MTFRAKQVMRANHEAQRHVAVRNDGATADQDARETARAPLLSERDRGADCGRPSSGRSGQPDDAAELHRDITTASVAAEGPESSTADGARQPREEGTRPAVGGAPEEGAGGAGAPSPDERLDAPPQGAAPTAGKRRRTSSVRHATSQRCCVHVPTRPPPKSACVVQNSPDTHMRVHAALLLGSLHRMS